MHIFRYIYIYFFTRVMHFLLFLSFFSLFFFPFVSFYSRTYKTRTFTTLTLCFFKISDSKIIPDRLKPRPCKICNKVISNARNMLKHMLVHNPVKIPYRCALCQCEYSREETLRWHLKAKHGIVPNRNTSHFASNLFHHHQHL